MSTQENASATDVVAEADRAAKANAWGRADLLTCAGDLIRVLDKCAFFLSRAKRYNETLHVLAVLREREPETSCGRT